VAVVEQNHPNDRVTRSQILLDESHVCVELWYRLVLVVETVCQDLQIRECEVDVGLQDFVVVAAARNRVVSDLLLRNVRSLGQ
jgi:hypothetical protein